MADYASSNLFRCLELFAQSPVVKILRKKNEARIVENTLPQNIKKNIKIFSFSVSVKLFQFLYLFLICFYLSPLLNAFVVFFSFFFIYCQIHIFMLSLPLSFAIFVREYANVLTFYFVICHNSRYKYSLPIDIFIYMNIYTYICVQRIVCIYLLTYIEFHLIFLIYTFVPHFIMQFRTLCKFYSGFDGSKRVRHLSRIITHLQVIQNRTIFLHYGFSLVGGGNDNYLLIQTILINPQVGG